MKVYKLTDFKGSCFFVSVLFETDEFYLIPKDDKALDFTAYPKAHYTMTAHEAEEKK